MQTEQTRAQKPWNLAAAYVHDQLARLAHAGNVSYTKAALAHLRRGIGKAPGSLAQLWAYTLDGMPEELTGRGSAPSRGEWACYLAITLYALHQQGKDITKENMNQSGHTLGKSIRKLIKDKDDEERVKRRFDQVITADSPQEIAHYLRSIIQLLKAEGIALDYPALARDLYLFLHENQRDRVRLSWGRDYYAYTGSKDQENNQNDEETTESEETQDEE